jgi:upstream activation factor subunit UAF30
LGASDLEVISAKRIRRGIQELLNVDLDSYKKDMDAVIMDRFLRFQQSVKQAEKVKKKSKSTMDDALQNVESDEMVAARLHSELNHRSIRESSMRRSRATKKATRKKSDKPQSEKRRQAAENNPFNEKLNLSNDLQNIVGEAQLTRPHVVKALWAYIKEHSLQNPDDKREILCDDLLKPIFGESKW